MTPKSPPPRRQDSVMTLHFVNRELLHTDLWYRYQHVAEFIGFTKTDSQCLIDHLFLLDNCLKPVLDHAYRRLFSYDATKSVFINHRNRTQQKRNSLDTTDTTEGKDDEIQVRKDFLKSYFMKIFSGEIDQKTVQFMDWIGRMHSVKSNKKSNLHVEYIHINALLGFLHALLIKEIIASPDLKGKPETQSALLEAITKVFWIQNDLFTRHYVKDEDGYYSEQETTILMLYQTLKDKPDVKEEFTKYMVRQHCPENMKYIELALRFEEEVDPDKRGALTLDIMRNHVEEGASDEINISSKLRLKTLQTYEKDGKRIDFWRPFTEEVLNLLLPYYQQFLKQTTKAKGNLDKRRSTTSAGSSSNGSTKKDGEKESQGVGSSVLKLMEKARDSTTAWFKDLNILPGRKKIYMNGHRQHAARRQSTASVNNSSAMAGPPATAAGGGCPFPH